MLRVEKKHQKFWELLDNWSLPPFRYCIILLPDSPARKMSQVCAERRRNMNCGNQQPDMWRCGKEPTQQLCFPSRRLGESWPFLPAPCPGMTQARVFRHHTAWFPLRKARQTWHTSSQFPVQLAGHKAEQEETSICRPCCELTWRT